MKMRPSILVTVGSGRFGREVLELLLRAQRYKVVAATQSPSSLDSFALRGVEVRCIEFDDEASLGSVFAGIDRLLLMGFGQIGLLGDRTNQLGRAVSAAERAGVQHLVYVSASHPDPDSPMLLAETHRATERTLATSSLAWTSLRLNFFMDCLWELVVCQSISGEISAAAGGGGGAFVTCADAARAAASALALPLGRKQVLEVTGPTLITFSQVVEGINSFATRKMTYLSNTPADAKRSLISCVGVSDTLAELIVSCQVSMKLGKYGPATHVVENLTGSPPMSLADYVLNRRRAWSLDRQNPVLP